MTNNERVMAKIEIYTCEVKAGEVLAALVQNHAPEALVSLAEEIIKDGQALQKEIGVLIDAFK